MAAGEPKMLAMSLNKVLHLIASIVVIFMSKISFAAAQQTCLGTQNSDPEISALYIDNFAGWHSIGAEAWLSFSSGPQLIFSLCNVDNDKNFLIAENNAGNQFNPSKFSRFEWFGNNGQLFYCQQVYDANTAGDAADFSKFPAANTSNPNDQGCGANGQFAWSQLSLITR